VFQRLTAQPLARPQDLVDRQRTEFQESRHLAAVVAAARPIPARPIGHRQMRSSVVHAPSRLSRAEGWFGLASKQRAALFLSFRAGGYPCARRRSTFATHAVEVPTSMVL